MESNRQKDFALFQDAIVNKLLLNSKMPVSRLKYNIFSSKIIFFSRNLSLFFTMAERAKVPHFV